MSIKTGLKSSVMRAAAAFVLMGLTGTGLGLADPSPVIERGYSKALAEAVPATTGSALPDAGSEAYWLGRDYGGLSKDRDVEPVVFQSPLSKGERLLVSKGTKSEIAEVVSVDLIATETPPAAATRLDVTAPPRRMSVTCRTADGATFRFVLEMQAPEPQTADAHVL